MLLVFEGILLNHQDYKLHPGSIFFYTPIMCRKSRLLSLNHGFHGQVTHFPVESLQKSPDLFP